MSLRHVTIALLVVAGCGGESPSGSDASTDMNAGDTPPPPPPPPADGGTMDVVTPDGSTPDAPTPTADTPTPPPVDVPVIPTDVPGVTCTRLLAPLSTTRVTSRMPSLQFAVGMGFTSTRIDICRDRACAAVVEAINAPEDYARPSAELAPGVYWWRAVNRTATGALCASQTWQFAVPARSGMTDGSWGTTLDVNGDGYADVAVGTAPTGAATRAVRVHHGGANGLSMTAATTIQGAGVGHAIASAGDVNGDGFPELGLSSITAVNGAGVVYIHYGSPAGVPATAALTITGPDGPTGHFGASLAGAGDLDGDGYGEVIVGTPRAGARGTGDPSGVAGRLHVFQGSSGGLVAAPMLSLDGPDGANGGYGSAVASAGDINADGFGDVLVGAPCAPWNAATSRCGAGRVYLYRGTAFGIQRTATQVFDAPAGVQEFGAAVAGAGDVNGDGRADLAVGAPGAEGSVFVYLAGLDGRFSDPPLRVQVMGASGLGQRVASAGDVNADGFADLFVGAPSSAMAWVFRGGAAGLTATPAVSWTGTGAPRTMTLLGATGGGAGDVNRDGVADVLVGDPLGGSGAGAVNVHHGGPTGPSQSPSATLRGGAGEMFGASIGGASAGP